MSGLPPAPSYTEDFDETETPPAPPDNSSNSNKRLNNNSSNNVLNNNNNSNNINNNNNGYISGDDIPPPPPAPDVGSGGGRERGVMQHTPVSPRGAQKQEFAARLAQSSNDRNNNNAFGGGYDQINSASDVLVGNSNPLARGGVGAVGSISVSALDEVKDEALESVEFTALLRQVDVGLEMTELLKEVVRKFSKHQLQDSTKLQEIYGKMQNVYMQMDGMQEFADICNLTHKLILETVQQQKVLAEFLANELVPKMTAHLQEKQSAVQILKKENQQAELKLQTSTTAMKKAENNFKQAAKKARNTAEPTGGPASRKKTLGDHDQSKGKRMLKGLKNTMKRSKSDLTEEEETYQKADQLAVAYEASVMTANHAQEKHIQICRHFKYRLRAIEESRMQFISNCMKIFVDKHVKFFEDKEVDKLRKQVVQRAEKLDASQDFETWIGKQIQTRGRATLPEKFAVVNYDYENAFYSLEDAMKVSRKVTGNQDLLVPLMMTRLCEKVKSTDGFITEGIFRISASVSDLEALRKSLYANDYNIKSNDPHVSAGMLKDWLRGLKDSLIPGGYYDACVEMAKKGTINAERLNVFISQLPEVNRESLRYLVSFLNELLAPQNTKITRMNVENIAIVFAPTVLRCPIEDPQLMLMNTKHEQAFMVQLIENLKS